MLLHPAMLRSEMSLRRRVDAVSVELRGPDPRDIGSLRQAGLVAADVWGAGRMRYVCRAEQLVMELGGRRVSHCARSAKIRRW